MHIKIKAYPNSKKEKVVKISDEKYEVFVKEKTERGNANKAVLKAVANFLKIKNKKIRIIKGQKTPNKIIEI